MSRLARSHVRRCTPTPRRRRASSIRSTRMSSPGRWMSAASWPRVNLGEADNCIVYASDAIACNRAGITVDTMKFPIESTPVYPVAPVAGGNTELAQHRVHRRAADPVSFEEGPSSPLSPHRTRKTESFRCFLPPIVGRLRRPKPIMSCPNYSFARYVHLLGRRLRYPLSSLQTYGW